MVCHFTAIKCLQVCNKNMQEPSCGCICGLYSSEMYISLNRYKKTRRSQGINTLVYKIIVLELCTADVCVILT